MSLQKTKSCNLKQTRLNFDYNFLKKENKAYDSENRVYLSNNQIMVFCQKHNSIFKKETKQY